MPEKQTKYVVISDVAYVGLNTYFEFLFERGEMITVSDAKDAYAMGFDKAIKMPAGESAFYIAMKEEDYEAAKSIGNPDTYFIIYNNLIRRQYEKILYQNS